MKITIPTDEIKVTYDGVDGTNNTTPEARVTIDNWQISGRIKPQIPSFSNGNSLFEDGETIYEVTKENLNDIHAADGIIFENPFVWEADVEIFDLPMQDNIPSGQIPPGGTDHFSNITKFTTAGTSIKTVGEWLDSICEVWRNDVLGKVQIYTNPINGAFIEYHLVKAFEKEYTVAKHPSLTNNTDAITITDAIANRALDAINWIKQQP
jgi:hypothetical protein